MKTADSFETFAYKGVDGTPTWLLVVIGVLTVVGIVVGQIRRNR
ncbi:hypothetical protein [Streptomyces sp. SID486]|nr:hypothetical protein [Streptomyces sp. SID486]